MYGNADHCYDAAEYFIGHGIWEVGSIDVICRSNAWNTDRMRSYSEYGFKMFGMH